MKALTIDKFTRGDSFLQANLFKRYKYIDTAGELINLYTTKDQPLSNIRVGLNELIIPNPHPNIEELKISHQVVWMKFGST